MLRILDLDDIDEDNEDVIYDGEAVFAKEEDNVKQAAGSSQEVDNNEADEHNPNGENGDAENRAGNHESEEPDSPKSNSSDSDSKQPKSPTFHSFFKSLKMKSSKTALHFHFQPLPSLGVSKRVRKIMEGREDIVPVTIPQLDEDMFHFKSSWRNFSLSELQHATSNFSQGLLFINYFESIGLRAYFNFFSYICREFDR